MVLQLAIVWLSPRRHCLYPQPRFQAQAAAAPIQAITRAVMSWLVRTVFAAIWIWLPIFTLSIFAVLASGMTLAPPWRNRKAVAPAAVLAPIKLQPFLIQIVALPVMLPAVAIIVPASSAFVKKTHFAVM